MSGRCRGGCGYWPGQNFSGNCAECMKLIKERGEEKRGVSKRPRSVSPPTKSKSVINAVKSKDVNAAGKGGKRAKGRGYRPTTGRTSDNDFELSQSPKGGAAKLPTATATATKSKGGAAPPVKKALNKAVPGVSLLVTAASPKKVAATAAGVSAAAVVQSPGKQPGFQPPAGMFPKAVLQVFHKANEGINARKDKDVQGKEQQEVLPGGKKTWSQFPPGQDVSPDSTVVPKGSLESVTVHDDERGFAWDDSLVPAADEGIPAADEDYDCTNPSAAFAIQSGPPPIADSGDIHFDLGIASQNAMTDWWDVFLNGKLGGGFLARSLLCLAHSDATLPTSSRWTGQTSMTQKKSVLIDMRQQFLDWTEDPTIHEWVRSKLFHIICTNPKTYGKLKVTGVFLKK